MKRTPLTVATSVVLTCSLVVSMHIPTAALAAQEGGDDAAQASEEATSHVYDIDMSAWSYDSSNDVYYQIGIVYCDDAQADDYESLGIYVPGAYFTGTKNSDGTYTCVVDEDGASGDYTATTAPIVMPINTSGYSAQEAPTSYSYSTVSSYVSEGIIYVYAGCRGRNNGTNSDNTSYDGGAPWGVTDLKAAVRCLRYNADDLPGDMDAIFSFGHSGGGAQSAVLGATGDSSLYTPYLESIGAAMTDADGDEISDAIAGAMCWCPITSLDVADEAYEWMMGQYATSGTRASSTWTSAFSDDLAEAFAAYVNEAGFVDEDGTALTLEATDEGIYTEGTYYDYVLETIETSLNNYLEDETYASDSSSSDSSGPGGDSGPGSGDSGPGGSAPSSLSTLATSYETAADYIESLNSDEEWVEYDEDTNTVQITSVEAFVNHCKSATKDVGAFDDLELSQAENYVFGNGDSDALHFDATMTALLNGDEADDYAAFSDYDASYASDYADDMGNTDALDVATEVRQNMYNPLYYVLASEEGCGTSTPAKYWRIRSGIEQGDTSLTTEMNLALALQANDEVESVDFAAVWEQGHTEAERTGDADDNFIEWIADCLSTEAADDGDDGDDATEDDGTTDDGSSDDSTTDGGTSDGGTDDGTSGDSGGTDDGTSGDGGTSDDGTSDDSGGTDDGTSGEATDGDSSGSSDSSDSALPLYSENVTLSATSFTYNGKKKTPEVTVRVNRVKLVKGSDYTVTYASGRKAIGSYKVTVKGTGDYYGTVTKTFKIVPGKVTLKSVKAGKKGSKKLTAKWKKLSGGVSYQVAYKAKGGKWKYAKVSGKKGKKVLKKLKRGKKYTVKVRACKKASGKTYYGAWSKSKSVKVK